MGTDIHAVFQKRTAAGWEDVQSTFEENRHYYLFSILANVRNGYGFAGVPTYQAVEPIAMPRGFPADFIMETVETVDDGGYESTVHIVTPDLVEAWKKEYYSPEDPDYTHKFMGDHSFSWLTADEILAYADGRADMMAQHTGVMSLGEYNEWDKVSPPTSYSGSVWGHNVQVDTPDTISHKTTHVQVAWTEPAIDQIAYFFTEIRRLKAEHGDVRMVFGFDS